MSNFSVGDLAQLFLLKRQNATVKQEITDRSTEMTTGLPADKAKHLSGDFAPLASLQTSLAQLAGFASINAETSMMSDAMQTTLATIDGQAGTVSTTLLMAGQGGATANLGAIGFDAEQSFRTAMSALNTRFGDRSLFAGQKTDSAALGDADTVLNDLTTLTAGMQTVQQVSDALDSYFADGGTFDTTIYQGGPPLAPLQVAPDETAQLNIVATDPALKATLKGLAMGALLNHGVLGGNVTAQSDLAQNAGETLLAGATGRAQLAAHLGTIQARISDADTRNQAQITSLKLAQSSMLSIDQYESTSQLQAAQTQLEALYTITARISKLSLADYLS
jgi:flagellar hook-associated protein 3 FlgL